MLPKSSCFTQPHLVTWHREIWSGVVSMTAKQEVSLLKVKARRAVLVLIIVRNKSLMLLWRALESVLYLYLSRERKIKIWIFRANFLSVSLLQLSSANPVYEKFYRQVCMFWKNRPHLDFKELIFFCYGLSLANSV